MATTTVWQYGSSNLENPGHLEMIRQWWSSLQGKEIQWQQRLIPIAEDFSSINWDESQRFDETFAIAKPELRGITLYWFKPDHQQERNITPYKLELDQLRQQLYIFPQSQQQVVIRVTLPQVQYQMIELNNPEFAISKTGLILLRDSQQLLEVKITLSPEKIAQLKQQLP